MKFNLFKLPSPKELGWSNSNALHSGDPNHNKLWTDLSKMDQEILEKEEEMILRLMKIRKHLWT